MDISNLVNEAYHIAQQNGFYENKMKTVSDHLMHIVKEVSEAQEAYEENEDTYGFYYSGNDQKPEGFSVELADIVILCASIAGHYGINLDYMIQEKLEYNKRREY